MVFFPFGHELLVTIFYDGNYYEVACKAIIGDAWNQKFELCNLRFDDENLFAYSDISVIKWLNHDFDNFIKRIHANSETKSNTYPWCKVQVYI